CVRGDAARLTWPFGNQSMAASRKRWGGATSLAVRHGWTGLPVNSAAHPPRLPKVAHQLLFHVPHRPVVGMAIRLDAAHFVFLAGIVQLPVLASLDLDLAGLLVHPRRLRFERALADVPHHGTA